MGTSAKLIAISLPLLLAACSQQAEVDGEFTEQPKVTVQVMQPQLIQLTEQFMGKTLAVDQVEILPKISGYLISQVYTDGAQVKKGDLLFEIDPKPFQAEVARLEANLAQKTAQMMLQAKKHEKAQALLTQDALSSLEVEQIEAELLGMKAEVQSAKAALNYAQLDLENTRIFAPFDGVMSDSRVSVGALVGPDVEPLTTLVSSSAMHVDIKLDEKQYLNDLQQRVQAGEEIASPEMALTLANGTLYHHKGEVDFIDNHVDSRSGSIRFRVTFPNPEGLLVPGQFVSVSSRQQVAQQQLVVPQAVVQEDQGGRYVFTVNQDNVVEARYVKLGLRQADSWIVQDGLQAGERVILSGLQSVRAGVEVDVQQPVALAKKG
ncbi:efflux RND transporter periplasmic adaptor subunit [Shewanella sp. JBTF-M18]|uniref:Efflux RND transporter periplasmic adaptor subunit n=1 Tax=Shewanella insulae TaxID=2681496 RepID=A0A6L7I211_9GAMM|nr:efflux RND transporter periplasmic adaptor subunit [Shewanella insulae]MXR70300.1 efflux RND transporter periplasmic adaptor subunit [Shewanella insulae]